MPRKQRIEASGAIQHVIARGNAGTRIVADDHDRQALVGSLARVSERSGWRVHAYCLMDTHLHAVIETPESNLGRGMQRLLGAYAYEFNRRHDRFGRLFAGPYKASLVDTDAYAVELAAYVVLNPVRAGLVADPSDWRWSSYRATAGLISVPAFIETRLTLGLRHEDAGRARELYREMVREAAKRPATTSPQGQAEA